MKMSCIVNGTAKVEKKHKINIFALITYKESENPQPTGNSTVCESLAVCSNTKRT